jgi:hypothetical protein
MLNTWQCQNTSSREKALGSLKGTTAKFGGLKTKRSVAYEFLPAMPLGGRAAPKGLRTVIPYLHPRGTAQLIDFLKRAFDAKQAARSTAGRTR